MGAHAATSHPSVTEAQTQSGTDAVTLIRRRLYQECPNLQYTRCAAVSDVDTVLGYTVLVIFLPFHSCIKEAT